MGNLLFIIFFGTISLSLILFLLYLRYVLKSFVSRRNYSSSLSSSYTSELQDGQKNSSIKDSDEAESATDTVILMIPLQNCQCCKENDGNGFKLCKKYKVNQMSDFFRLPLKREDSSVKFDCVDDLKESSKLIQTCNTRSVAYFGRRGRNPMYRKSTWEMSAIVRVLTNTRADAEHYKAVNSSSARASNHSLHIMSSAVIDGAIDKEVLI